MRYERGSVVLVLEGRTRLHCGACGCVFENPFQSRCEVDGEDDDDDLIDAMDDTIDSENRFHWQRACPNCHAPPTRHVGSTRKSWDIFTVIAALGAYFGVAVAWNHGNSTGTDLKIAAGVFLATASAQLLIHLSIAKVTASRSSRLEIRRTEELRLRILPAEQDGLPPHFHWPDRNPAYGLLACAVGVACIPMAYLFSLEDRLNADHAPGLVAPGQRVNVRMQTRLTSLRSVWCGTVAAESRSLNDPGGRAKTIDARVPHLGTIESTMFTTKDRETPFSPVVDVAIPPDAALADQTMVVDIRLTPTVARLGGGVVIQEYPEIRESVSIKISSPGEVDTARSILWSAGATTLAALSAGVWLYFANVRMAKFPKPEVFIAKRPKSARPLKNFSWKEHRNRGRSDDAG